MIERFFTTEQVADILQVHPLTILKFIKQGKLRGVKIGRVYRIQESYVKQFLDERTMHGSKLKTEPLKKEENTPIEKELPKQGKQEGGDGVYYII